MKFKDYYETIGVPRSATPDESSEPIASWRVNTTPT